MTENKKENDLERKRELEEVKKKTTTGLFYQEAKVRLDEKQMLLKLLKWL